MSCEMVVDYMRGYNCTIYDHVMTYGLLFTFVSCVSSVIYRTVTLH